MNRHAKIAGAAPAQISSTQVLPNQVSPEEWQARSSRAKAAGDLPGPGTASTIGPVGVVDAQPASRLAQASAARTIELPRSAVIGATSLCDRTNGFRMERTFAPASVRPSDMRLMSEV